MRKDIALLAICFLIVLFVPLVQAQVAVEAVRLIPEEAAPGKQVLLKILLENVGEDDLENVAVQLDLSTVPFASVGSSSEKALGKIREGREEVVSFTLSVLPEAVPMTYKIPLTLTWQSGSATSLVSVPVVADAHLSLLAEYAEPLLVGKQGKVMLKFVNDGLAPISFLKAAVLENAGYKLLSPPALFIGEVNVADFETEELEIISSNANLVLTLNIEYRDQSNKIFQEQKLLPLEVYSKEEAQQLGLYEDSSMIFLILGGALIVFILFLAWRRRKKNHAA